MFQNIFKFMVSLDGKKNQYQIFVNRNSSL